MIEILEKATWIFLWNVHVLHVCISWIEANGVISEIRLDKWHHFIRCLISIELNWAAFIRTPFVFVRKLAVICMKHVHRQWSSICMKNAWVPFEKIRYTSRQWLCACALTPPQKSQNAFTIVLMNGTHNWSVRNSNGNALIFHSNCKSTRSINIRYLFYRN